MAIINVKRLSHVALNARNVEIQTEFYAQIAGLEKTGSDDQGCVYLRCNADHHSLMLIPAQKAGLNHYALEIDGRIENAATALERAGIPFRNQDFGESGQGPSLRITDPDGFTVELVGRLDQVDPAYGPRAVKPRRIAHITLLVDDVKVSAKFYEEVLGFRVSDWFEDVFVWMRCNPEHHTIALARLERIGLHHVAFDVLDFAAIAHQGDHLVRNGRSFVYGPGRHGPGHNQFAYFYDEEQNIVEYTCDSMQIWDEENYEPKFWSAGKKWINVWGQDPPAEFLK